MIYCSRCEKDINLCKCKEEIKARMDSEREKYKHLLDGKHTLAEILNIKEETPQLSDLVKHSSFVRAYQVWDFKKGRRYDLISSLQEVHHLSLDWLVMLSGEEDSYSFLNDLIEKASETELKEVYNITVKGIENNVKNPNSLLYYWTLQAYVEVLRTHESMGICAGILSRYIIPSFAEETFLENKEVKRIVKKIPEEEIDADKGFEVRNFLHKISEKGITLQEAKDYVTDVVKTKNEHRNRMHKELLKYGESQGYSYQEVMADIVFDYHERGQQVQILKRRKELYLSGGVLLLHEQYYNVGSVSEGNFELPEKVDSKDEDAEWKNMYYERAVENKKTAEKFLEEHLAGNERFKGQYSSNIDRLEKNTEELDTKLLLEVKEANKDLEIEVGFRPSHCCHGSVVYGLSLRVQMDSFHKAQNPEQRLTDFMNHLKEKFPLR